MPEQVHFGTVKIFFKDPDTNGKERRFGFIIPDVGGPDIWFHYDQGEVVVALSSFSKPEFFGHAIETDHPGYVEDSNLVAVKTNEADSLILRDPHEGDRVAFYLVKNNGRRRASPWGYESQWKSAETLLPERIAEVTSDETR